MKKGKFGLSMLIIAAISFVFVALKQPIPALLICGYALLAEKDEWLKRQTIQALLLLLVYYLVDLVLSWIFFGSLITLFGWLKLYGAASAMSTVGKTIGDLLYFALIVLSVIAAVKVLRGKDAGLPVVSKMADEDFVMKAKVKPAPAAPAYTPYPMNAAQPPPQYPAPDQSVAQAPPQYSAPPQYVAPEQAAAPVPPQYVAPEQSIAPDQPSPVDQPAPIPSVRQCPVCSAPLGEDARFCAECGTQV